MHVYIYIYIIPLQVCTLGSNCMGASANGLSGGTGGLSSSCGYRLMSFTCVLQCVAVCVTKCVAVFYSVLQCFVVYRHHVDTD